MAVELELISQNGNVSFTTPGAEYLDVEQGRGMEPGDPKFTEKVFARSLLKQGATFALESLHEKEMIFPLKLHAANKDALTTLVREINIALNTSGTVVKWKDEGASKPTYFNLLSGQIDDEFDFRLAASDWLKVRMRLFVQPLGYYSINGAHAAILSGTSGNTLKATSPMLKFVSASQLLGDAPALVQAEMTQINLSPQMFAAFSILPVPTYTPALSSASLYYPTGLREPHFSHESLAPGGTAARIPPGFAENPFAYWESPSLEAAGYVGQQRILVAARTPSLAEPQPFYSSQFTGLPLSNWNYPASGALAVATPLATTAWQVFDMGIVNVASSAIAANAPYGFTFAAVSVTGASRAVELASVFQLPEISTSWLNTSSVPFIENFGGHITWDGVSNTVRLSERLGVPASETVSELLPSWLDVTGLSRGAIPQAQPGANAPAFAIFAMPKIGSNTVNTSVHFNVLERCRFAF